MFTLNQIADAYKKIKSGADFPKLFQDLKFIGVSQYDHNVVNGQTTYYGANNFSLKSEAKYPALEISNTGSADKLKHALSIHQQAQTDYLTFCKHAAEAGVEKWITDMNEMCVSYLDKDKNVLSLEKIPTISVS